MNHSTIELDFSENLNEDHPKCQHGPTLLFREGDERFFACSACRDRRQCDIYVSYAQKKLKSIQPMLRRHQREYEQFKKHIRTLKNNRKQCRLRTDVRYCYTCSILFLDQDLSVHAEHQMTDHLTPDHRQQPCRFILKPLKNKRTDAQFFFHQSFIDYLVEKIILVGPWDSVICIGCPTIFENIHRRIKSYLLDYDHRFYSFYSAKEMLVFNMFNGHIFSPRKLFNAFLSTIHNCLIIIDPPFGGFHRALSHSIEQLFQSKSIQQHMIIFNPYFLEKWVVQAFPQLKMLDYKVEYSSDSSLNLCRGKKGSPVRMFTNLSSSLCPPVDDLNYKFCFECDRYTLITNQHCYHCQSCTSKDGLPYRHCTLCRRCVKAERKHCSKCDVCHLPNQCLEAIKKRPAITSAGSIKRKKVT